MRSGKLTAVLAVLMAISLLTPDVALAAKSEIGQLEDQLADVRAQAEKAGEAYSEAYWVLDKTNASIAQSDKELAQLKEELAVASASLSERAVEMYRSGSVDYLMLLFSAETLDEMLMRLEYVQRLGLQDAETIAHVKTLQGEINEKRSQVLELQETQADEAAKLKKKSDALQDKLADIQADYDALQAKLDAARKATNQPASAKPGANGMVFPVKGAYTYTDTWGAARSGGRSHQGTDIMASHGTPLVAVMSGTIRSKSNTLGGLTIWLTADNGWAFYYAHLNGYAKTSGRVSAGEVIGYVGSTGNASASAPHCHFEIHPNGGSAVNPYPYLKAME
ncbi:MAG: peptidoglycan DD-metalloendopeptidase family protein [Coriobacteriia bacterium]|nr:peptidoglycan DD-metalloendopeptidase family protein [Coriobacteriia bacterium]MBN2822733.1 peptidoglycan DD-metalloendopeptidase family protein [Coriobacteriia bacterium]